MSDQKTCFVISPIGDEGTEEREHANEIYELIEDATRNLEYNCDRADKIDAPGKINTQVLERVVDSDLVIADLTRQNPNVFYELAVRHTHNKPTVQIIKNTDNIPFDLFDQRTVEISFDDYSSSKESRSKIKEQIRAVESGDYGQNPVSAAEAQVQWRQSDNPEERNLADITDALNEINSKVDELKNVAESNEAIQAYSETELRRLFERIDSMEIKLNEVGESLQSLLQDAEEKNLTAPDMLPALGSIYGTIEEINEDLHQLKHTTGRNRHPEDLHQRELTFR